MASQSDSRTLLRHAVATLAYRCGKALRGAPPDFAALKAGPSTRTPAEILAHIGDLLDWAGWLARGIKGGQNTTPLAWDAEVARFFSELKKFDDFLASDAPLAASPEQLFQGPIADALTHTG